MTQHLKTEFPAGTKSRRKVFQLVTTPEFYQQLQTEADSRGFQSLSPFVLSVLQQYLREDRLAAAKATRKERP